ncbi:MAG: hypothetical protein GX345_06850 [Clostridiales bacterium]|nr:hypothetical protein [Clostridiales bacterium]
MKKSLLNSKKISPQCSLCVHGKPTPDGLGILCIKKGLMRPDSKCRRFLYDPLKRVPRRQPALPTINPEDFEF